MHLLPLHRALGVGMSLWQRWSLAEKSLAMMLLVAIALAVPQVRFGVSVDFRFSGQLELGEN